MNEFLCSLDDVCGCISSLTEVDQGADGNLFYIAKMHTTDELVEALTAGEPTRAKLLDACEHTIGKYARQEINAYKSMLSKSIDGIDMLAVMAASVGNQEVVMRVLGNKHSEIKHICTNPPRELLHCMGKRGLSPTVLTVLLQHCGPSIAKAAAIFSQYVNSSGLAVRLHDACVEAVACIRNLLELEPRARSWDQVALTPTVRALGNASESFDIKAPQHLARSVHVAVCHMPHDAPSLRISRLSKALTLCIQGNMFESTQLSVPFLRKVLRDMQSTSPRKRTSEWCPPATECIPVELRRDFHIMIAIEKHLPRGAGAVRVAMLTEAVMQPGGFFEEGTTRRSVDQAVHHVMRKCAHQVIKQIGDDAGVKYIKSETPACTIGHLELDACGSARLLLHVRELIACMAAKDKCSRSQWRASRSSRQVAAAARRGVTEREGS
jgi:hypothetical protein